VSSVYILYCNVHPTLTLVTHDIYTYIYTNRAARLAAALGHGGKHVPSAREHHRKNTSVRLFTNAEEERSADIKARALDGSSSSSSSLSLQESFEVGNANNVKSPVIMLGSPIDPVQQENFNQWDPMVLSKALQVSNTPSVGAGSTTTTNQSLTMRSPYTSSPYSSSSSSSSVQTLTFGRKSPMNQGVPPPLPITSIDSVKRDGVETAAGAGMRTPLPELSDKRLFQIEQKALDPCPHDIDDVTEDMLDEIRYDYNEAAAAAVVAYNVMAAQESIPSNQDKVALHSATTGFSSL
jgi:hypothetical protein